MRSFRDHITNLGYGKTVEMCKRLGQLLLPEVCLVEGVGSNVYTFYLRLFEHDKSKTQNGRRMKFGLWLPDQKFMYELFYDNRQ